MLRRLLLRSKGLIEVSPKRDIRMLIPENQRWTFAEGDYYEQNFSYWFEKLLSGLKSAKKSFTVYDVGANCGYYSLLAGSVAEKVFSFEPSKATRTILKKNIRLNQRHNVVVSPVALTNQTGELTFHTYSSSGNNSLVKRDIPAGHELKYRKSYRVKADKLDNLVKKSGFSAPDFIKIDVEGAELFTLKGAKQCLKRTKPVVLVEYSEATCRDAGYEREEIKTFLIDLDYKIFGLSSDNQTTKLMSVRKSAKISNLLAIHKDDPLLKKLKLA